MEEDDAVSELPETNGECLTIVDFIVILMMICTDTSKCNLSDALLKTSFSMLKQGSHIDVICDRYNVADSIKASERARRGQVMMQEIKIYSEHTPLPKQRIKFLSNPRNDENVSEFLFNLWQETGTERLKEEQGLTLAGGFSDGKVVKVTRRGYLALANYPCDFEEEDSRIFFHVAKAVEAYSLQRIIIWSIGTDVAAICQRTVFLNGLQELFFKTGVKDKKQYILMHQVAYRTGQELSEISPILHASTGCDSTSAFASHGNRKC